MLDVFVPWKRAAVGSNATCDFFKVLRVLGDKSYIFFLFPEVLMTWKKLLCVLIFVVEKILIQYTLFICDSYVWSNDKIKI